MSTGEFPNKLKITHINVIYKISLLANVSKKFEKIMYMKSTKNVGTEIVFPNFQNGFRKLKFKPYIRL